MFKTTSFFSFLRHAFILCLFLSSCIRNLCHNLNSSSNQPNSSDTGANRPHNDSEKPPEVIVVCLPGWNMGPSQFDAINNTVQKTYPGKVKLIVLEKRSKRHKSTFLPISIRLPGCVKKVGIDKPVNATQVSISYSEIEEKVKKESEAWNSKIGKIPVVLIGISQGGLVAIHLMKNYAKELNIKGLITVNTCIKGLPWLKNSKKVINDVFSDNNRVLFKKEFGLHNMQNHVDVLKNLLSWPKVALGRGLACMQSNNSSVKIAQEIIKNPPSDIQFLMIESVLLNPCGSIKNKTHDDTSDTNLGSKEAEINDAIARALTGHADELHDGLVPLTSQLCLDNSYKLNTLDIKTKKKIWIPTAQDNVKKLLVADKAHCENFMLLGCRINAEVIENSPDALAEIARFCSPEIMANKK